MNWKNVLRLLLVERKSGRLIRGTIRFRKYSENIVVAYWPYWVAAIIGVLGGLLANFIASSFYSSPDSAGIPPLGEVAPSFYSVLPTLVLGISIVFTLFQQIQLAGKASSQVMYWLPVTWEEHTLASVLASLSGLPAAVVTGLSAGLMIFSVFNGLILQAMLTIAILVASAFLASAVTEIVRVLQVRFTGALYKSSGRAAIWLRLIGSLLVIAVFYSIYFYAVSGTSTFITSLTAIQNSAWYVPFVWPALIVSYLTAYLINPTGGLLLQGILFTALTAVLIAALYFIAVELNKRFGLYEPPAIRLQKSGVYSPKTGTLGKIGFSSVEAALIRKDLRALTRRKELMGVYIMPIIIAILAIFYSFGFGNAGGGSFNTSIWAGVIFLVPASGIAMLLGQVLIGEEGQSVWRIYASPISAKNLVKSKLFIVLLFSVIILVITSSVGVVVFHPSLRKVVIAIIEALLIATAVGSVSFQIGLRGPDFSGARKQRMVRQEWSLIGSIVATITGAGVFAPVFAQYGLALLTNTTVSTLNYAIGVVISAIISTAISAIFYKININAAKNLLLKAET